MTDQICIALAQLNPTVGDVPGNLALIRKARDEAGAAGADLVVYPELIVSGYPPEDLVLKPFFLDVIEEGVRALAAETQAGGVALLISAPWRDGTRLRNAALLLEGGGIKAVRYKVDLPNYGVFDEKRVFEAGPPPGPFNFRGVRIGVPICEDIWSPDIVETLAESGAEILVVPNGSPFEIGKQERRLQLVIQRVTECGLPMLYVNQVGGQDELVFDGGSFAIDGDCSLAAQGPSFAEKLMITRWERKEQGWRCVAGDKIAPADGIGAIYGALVLGLRDYVTKNRFPGVLLGLSGGIDSALAAAIATDAIGPDRVQGVMMPSPYTSQDSLDDAAASAALLGCRLDNIPIIPAMDAFNTMLATSFAGRQEDITEENIQSRSRGVALMALSNKFGSMVLATGNKSEMSVGYATLYGDMCGGYAILKDVYKTTVYELCRWRNAHVPDGVLGPNGPVVPDNVLTKAPTAELKPNQKDQDSLPPYDVLDDILECLVEKDMCVADIVARGHEPATVNRVWRLLHLAEYKRRQAPPGAKITERLFNRERRYPITNGFTSIVKS